MARTISTAALLSLLLLLLAGCASPPFPLPPAPSAPPQPSTTPQFPSSNNLPNSSGQISVPFSPISYTAVYVVSEEGGDTQKTVWRSGNSMKIRFGLQGAGVELYLLSGKAYSCPSLSKVNGCFDVTSQMAGAKLGELFLSPPKNYEGQIETVDIGGTSGSCYTLASTGLGSRKTCFTNDGILAYDEYNVTKKSKHIEYLSDLSYGVSPSEFILPAPAKAPPT